MNVVMTGIFLLWTIVPVHYEMPKVTSSKQTELKKVTVRFQLQRRTIITCGPHGCQIVREGQIAAKK